MYLLELLLFFFVKEHLAFSDYSLRSNGTDFCNLTCNGGENVTENVACKCEMCPTCGEFNTSMELVRRWWIEIHNALRNHVSLGRDNRAGMSVGVKNMHVLNYDMDLEQVARCFGRKVEFNTSDCLRTPIWKKPGMNLYRGKTRQSSEMGVKIGVIKWYQHIRYLSAEQMEEMADEYFNHTPSQYFSQLMWAQTTHVGCYRTWNGSVEQSFLVCLYGERGNVEGREMLKLGTACTECGNETCNDLFSGLCGVIFMEGIRGETKSGAPEEMGPGKLMWWIFPMFLFVFFRTIQCY